MMRADPHVRLGKLGTERWRHIEAILNEALELPTAEIPAFLDRACAGDAELRAQVEDVLAADENAGPFLSAPALESVAALVEAWAREEPLEPALDGRHVGPYRLVREIGRGGMGAVYLAERTDGQFEQRVAVKLIKRGLDTDEILSRFVQERQILARLQHPHIARLLDGGVTEDGRPWFAMEHVEGRPLTAWCRERGLGLDDRLRLFDQVCDAVEYAHHSLVVHRDLKPSNILATTDDRVKLLDFGIAKVLDPAAAELPETRTAARLMTPHYAAPEQIRGEPPTTATDVYALGVVLYELLSGVRPYRRKMTSAADAERAVLEEEPEPLSAATLRRADGGAAAPGTAQPGFAPDAPRPAPPDAAPAPGTGPTVHPRAWRDRLKRDLDNMAVMALRKEPERRYPSAEALREDLHRYLGGRPVRATPPTWTYRTGKFVRRNRVPVTAGALVALALVAGLLTTAWQAQVARQERDNARLEAQKAKELKDFALNLFTGSDPFRAGNEKLSARELVDRAERRVAVELPGQPEVQAEMMAMLGQVYRSLGQLDRAQALHGQALATRRALHGAKHPGVAAGLNDLGAVFLDAGKYDQAATYLQQALEMRRDLLGVRSHEFLVTYSNIGVLKVRRGDYRGAEAVFRELVESAEQVHGRDHERTLAYLNNLGSVLIEQQRHREAEPFVRRVVEARRRTLGPEHASTLQAAANLAACLDDLGQYAEAESLLQAVLEGRKKIFGPTHDAVAHTYVQVAGLRRKQGELESAVAALLTALDIRSQALGPEHPSVATLTTNLGELSYVRGDLGAADRYFGRTLAIRRKALGGNHRLTLVPAVRLADVRREQGRHGEAQRLLDDALPRLRATLGQESAEAAMGLGALGRLEADRGRPAAAERSLQQALAIERKVGAARETMVPAELTALADLYRDQGRARESLALYQEARAIWARPRNPAAPPHADLLVGLGRLLVAEGRPAEAESLLRAGLTLRERFSVPHSLRLAEARTALGLCLAAQGKDAEAESLLAAGLPVLERCPGGRDPLVRAAAEALSRIRAQSIRP